MIVALMRIKTEAGNHMPETESENVVIIRQNKNKGNFLIVGSETENRNICVSHLELRR